MDLQTCLEINCRYPWAQACFLLSWLWVALFPAVLLPFLQGSLGSPWTWYFTLARTGDGPCLSHHPALMWVMPYLCHTCSQLLVYLPSWINWSFAASRHRHALWVPFKNCKSQIHIVCHHLALISMNFQQKYSYVSQLLAKSTERCGFKSKQVFRCD